MPQAPSSLPTSLFSLPALRRHQVGIAGVFAVVDQLGLGEEVVEADLPDLPAQLEACVPALGRAPAKRDATLGPEEFARRLVVVGAVEVRNFGARRDLEIEVGGKRPAQRRNALVADFLHRPTAFGEVDFFEIAVGRRMNSPPFWSSELNARSNVTCQSFLPVFQ